MTKSIDQGLICVRMLDFGMGKKNKDLADEGFEKRVFE